jgi:Rrf2 family protein
MVELAEVYPDQTVPLKEVAQQQNISVKYLEQLLRTLRLAGLVESARGTQGGYSLARPPADVTLRDIYRAVEKDDVQPVHCVDDPASCPMSDICSARDAWVEVKDSIVRVLEQTTIQDLAKKSTEKRALRRPMYYI